MSFSRLPGIFLISFFVAIGCNRDKNPLSESTDLQFRHVAWNFLSEYDRETVTIDWREAAITRDVNWGNQQNTISVIFPTTLDALLGPIVVVIDPESLQVLGIVPRK